MFFSPTQFSFSRPAPRCLKSKCIYIYIYVFSRRFYPKWLTVHSGYTFFCQYVCSLGIEPTTFTMLTQCSNHWATGTHLRPFVRPWSEKEVGSGALLACCYCEELNIDCAINQLKPGLKSMAQFVMRESVGGAKRTAMSKQAEAVLIHTIRSFHKLLFWQTAYNISCFRLTTKIWVLKLTGCFYSTITSYMSNDIVFSVHDPFKNDNYNENNIY